MMTLTDPAVFSILFPAALLCSLLIRRFFGEKGAKAVLLAAGLCGICLTDGRAAWLPGGLVIVTCAVIALPGKGHLARAWGVLCCLGFFLMRAFHIPGTTGFAFLIVEIVVCCMGKRQAGGLSAAADTALCMTFFPAYSSGPVRRPDAFRHMERPTADALSEGLMRLCIGFGKKMLIAENIRCLTAAGQMPGSLPGSLTALLFSALYVYYDFSGYTDMALGMAGCLGFPLPENFRKPFFASSVRDFWRRWHIPLSGFLRDHVYIPLGGSRKGPARACLNTLCVFAATILWHGLTVPYLCFGLWHALFVILEQRKILQPDRWSRAARHIYTLFVVLMGFFFFLSPDASALAGFLLPEGSPAAFAVYLSPIVLLSAAAAIALLFAEGRMRRLPEGLRWALCLIVLILSLMHRAGAGYMPFLYGTF